MHNFSEKLTCSYGWIMNPVAGNWLRIGSGSNDHVSRVLQIVHLPYFCRVDACRVNRLSGLTRV